VTPTDQGLYRIGVKTGGRDPVTQIVLCVPADTG
jgi:hypothetical protein